MANPVQQGVSAEVRRRLSPVPFVSSRQASLDIPRDTVIKRIEFRLTGYFCVTYASGSPIADPVGVASRLCPRLDLVADGSRTIKSVDIYMLEKEQLLLQGVQPERAYTKTAATTAPTSIVAAAEAAYGSPFDYDATTKYNVVNESFVMHLENPWAYDAGREATMLNTKRLSSCELRFNFVDISRLQEEGGAVAVTYSDINLSFSVTLVEASEVPAEAKFWDWKQSVKRVQFTAESRDALIDLPRGNLLCGIGFLVRDGGTNKLLSDTALKDIKLMINGQRLIQSTTLIELQQAGNRSRYGIVANKVAPSFGRTTVLHPLQGFAYMNLLKNGDIRSAIDTSNTAGVDQIQLQVTTAASSGMDAATYTTNPVEVSIMTSEVVRLS